MNSSDEPEREGDGWVEERSRDTVEHPVMEVGRKNEGVRDKMVGGSTMTVNRDAEGKNDLEMNLVLTRVLTKQLPRRRVI